MQQIIIDKVNLDTICSEHLVDKLYLFGSAATKNLKPDSDIDLLVRFRPLDLADYFKNYLNLKERLQSLFQRDIDLVEEQTLSNPFLIESIDKNKRLIYG